MTRPLDWTPLATSDPVPGDPPQVTAIARRHNDLADMIRQQATMLRDLAASDAWDADAGRVFTRSARDLAGRLQKAERRYTAVAGALGGYAPELDHAQREADAARLQAQDAHTRVVANTVPAGVAPAAADARRTAALDTATQDLAAARRRLQAAVDARNAAARAAAHRIQDAIDHDGLKDSFWDKVKDWSGDRWQQAMATVHRYADKIAAVATIASWVATVAGTLAIIVSFIPVVGQAVGAVLFYVALTATAVSLLCHLALALSGDAGWFDVGLDVFALVTLGYGRTAASTLKVANSALRSTAKDALANAQLRTRLAKRMAKATRVLRSPKANEAARRGAQDTVQRLEQLAAHKAALVTAKATETSGGLLSKLVYLDGETGASAATAKGLFDVVKQRAGVAATDLAAVEAAAAKVTGLSRVMAGTAAAATASDALDKAGLTGPFKEPTVWAPWTRHDGG